MSTEKKLSARERIEAFFDSNSFVEIGEMIHARSTDFNMADQKTPSDGVITGYGISNGRLVYAFCQDASVMNGSVGEMHAKKIIRMYDMALKMGAPVVGMIDCAGMRLQEATDALNAFGELYHRQIMASGIIPQIMGVFGTCGGGMALVPSLADFTFVVKDEGEIFINSPDSIKGNRIEVCNTSSSTYRSCITGDVDGVGETDFEVLLQMQQLVSVLPSNNKEDGLYMRESMDQLNRENKDISRTLDTVYILKDLSDQGGFLEIKPDYAKEMVTGFMILNGNTVGAVANREEVLDAEGHVIERMPSVLSVDGMKKAERFIRFCDAFSIPVLSLVNVSGFKASMEEEKELAKASAKLTYAYSSATVPKVTVIIGKAYGSAYLCMGSRHIGADLVYAWPNSEIGMMDAMAAVKIMYSDEIRAADDSSEFIKVKKQEYEAIQNSPLSAASRGYVDTIIDPAETRKHLIAAMDMLSTKREMKLDKKHGTV